MAQKVLVTLLFLLLVVMMACSGTLRGVVRGDARSVSLKYSDSKIGNADLRVVMPDGERFEGRVERGTEGTGSKNGATASMDRFEAVEFFDGNADAVLSGDRGNIMQCRFKLADILFGFKGGGFGICELSDGRIIDIFF